MKLFTKLFFLTIIDFIIIWLWVKQINPDPSVSIGILIFVPLVIVINLIIALIFYLFKRKFAVLFVVNSVVSGILMFYLFDKEIDRYQNEKIESWNFKLQDTSYIITHWKLKNTFSISESTYPGSSTGFLDGKFIKEGKEYYLTTDSTKYKIANGYFYGFRNLQDSIKLRKIER